MEQRHENKALTVRTSPSLALIKYWGKADARENTPATSSLAITLKGLCTETTVGLNDCEDTVFIDGILQPKERFLPVFQKIRSVFHTGKRFSIDSRSNFPASAGLASSSSGFAALAFGCSKLIAPDADIQTIGEIARLGSASASRALFEGFTVLRKNALQADPLLNKDFWPELRVIVAIVRNEAKKISSRSAMERAKESSPFYRVWIEESEEIFQAALIALQNRDLDTLGPLIRKSYLMMFSTMFTSTPPAIYWEGDSVKLIQACQALRDKGFSAWETMDAGPQVKIVTLAKDCPSLIKHLQAEFPHLHFLVTEAGDGPEIINCNSQSLP